MPLLTYKVFWRNLKYSWLIHIQHSVFRGLHEIWKKSFENVSVQWKNEWITRRAEDLSVKDATRNHNIFTTVVSGAWSGIVVYSSSLKKRCLCSAPNMSTVTVFDLSFQLSGALHSKRPALWLYVHLQTFVYSGTLPMRIKFVQFLSDCKHMQLRLPGDPGFKFWVFLETVVLNLDWLCLDF